jgi:hypothetical protein
MSNIKIEGDGNVTVLINRADTFLDFRLSLVERLEKFALLVGSNEWSAEQGPGAESLIREAALRLSGFMVEATSRKNLFDSLTTWNNTLRAENARLLEFCEMLEEENRRLKSESKDFWRTFG